MLPRKAHLWLRCAFIVYWQIYDKVMNLGVATLYLRKFRVAKAMGCLVSTYYFGEKSWKRRTISATRMGRGIIYGRM
jgi:hypothetical protein